MSPQFLDRALALGLLALALGALLSYAAPSPPVATTWNERCRELLDALISGAGPARLLAAYRTGGVPSAAFLLLSLPEASSLAALRINSQTVLERTVPRGYAFALLEADGTSLMIEAWV
jgi:tetrahydromethanopterin S-methyltransferase subunit C